MEEHMAGDWVKMHRDARDHAVFQDEWLWRLFSWCLMSANFKPTVWKGHSLLPGQFISGRHSASESLCVSPSKFKRGIDQLIELGCISTEVNSSFSVITVCNWSTYQSRDVMSRTAGDTPDDTADETPRDTACDTTADTADEQPTIHLAIQPVIQLADTEEEFKNLRINTGDLSPGDRATFQTGPSDRVKRFWSIYPKKTKKGEVEAAIEEAVISIVQQDGVTDEIAFESICEAAAAFAASAAGKAPFDQIPAPGLWLSTQRFWDDRKLWDASQSSKPTAAPIALPSRQSQPSQSPSGWKFIQESTLRSDGSLMAWFDDQSVIPKTEENRIWCMAAAEKAIDKEVAARNPAALFVSLGQELAAGRREKLSDDFYDRAKMRVASWKFSKPVNLDLGDPFKRLESNS
jgi:hypothetical protein